MNAVDSQRLLTISIVTPVFNAIGTIKETLASIAAQDYPNVEHVVVDAVSTDGTLELLDSLQAAGQIKLISEPDRGLSDAFNKGVKSATGDLIAWLNADDVYEPGALAAVAAAYAMHPDAEWFVGRCKIMGGDGGETRKPVTKYKNFMLRRFSLSLYLTNNFVSSPAVFINRDVLNEIGALDERFKYSADYDLWLRLAQRSNPVYIDSDIARFRMAETSLSITGFEDQFVEHAQNARENGGGHPIAVSLNRVMSRVIIWSYRSIMRWRKLRATSGSS